MNIYKKYISIFVVDLFVVFCLSTDAFTATIFYILPNNSNQKVDCDFLEIKNNQALCTTNNLLVTYDISHVKYIEVIRKGTSHHFQNFTPETINKINELNSDKSATPKRRIQEKNKKKRISFILDPAKSLKSNFKTKIGNNSLNTFLLISGLIVFLIGSVAFLIATFRAGILWGLSCLFLPFVSLIFLFVHWKTAAKPFLVSMLGITICCLSIMFPLKAEEDRSISKSKFNSNTTRAHTINNNVSFRCSGKIYCSEMSSCAEAIFYLRNCPGTKMDGDHDGIPCEKQWCGN